MSGGGGSETDEAADAKAPVESFADAASDVTALSPAAACRSCARISGAIKTVKGWLSAVLAFAGFVAACLAALVTLPFRWCCTASPRRQLRRELKRPEMSKNPVIADFPVRAGFDHTKLSLKKIGGLLFVQILVDPNGETLRTYWTTRQAFEANQRLLLQRAGLDASQAPSWTGVYRVTHESLSLRLIFRRYAAGLWAGLATVLLAVSYLEDIRNFAAWAILPPKAKLVAQDAKPVDVLVGERFSVGFEIVNNRNYGNCDVTLESPSFSPAGSKVTLDPFASPKFAAIEPGKHESFTVRGTASEAGEYTVTVVGEAEAGWFFTDEVTTKATVKAWKPVHVGQGAVAAGEFNDQLCKVQFELTLGRTFEDGIHVEAFLPQPEDLEFKERVLFPDNPAAYSGKEPEEASISWKTAALETRFKPIRFWLYLEGTSARREEDWKKVAESIKFDFPGVR